jgi:outer membrane protein OmpA-like peptidoglycan-associated protein
MNSTVTSVMTCAGLFLLGCASTPPQELVDARAAYKRAASGPAAELNPAQLHVAKQTLALAEQAFDDEGASFRARDRAYVAMRKAQLAEVQARTLQAEREAAQWRHQAEVSEQRMLARARQQASRAKEELSTAREQTREAERRAQEALQKLERIGKVSQDSRGNVISLSGSLLFRTGKSTLTPVAKRHLSQVADALKDTDPSTTILIEGHTDSTGSEELNQRLSTQRAETVRRYLIMRGIDRERIEAEGFGESRPIADNSTPEGRAINRRVEIVLANGQQRGVQQPAPGVQERRQGTPQNQRDMQKQQGGNESREPGMPEE